MSEEPGGWTEVSGTHAGTIAIDAGLALPG
jgi:hypothetical protein